MSGKTYGDRLARAEADAQRPRSRPAAGGDSPQARLLRVARKGQFEELVAELRPAQPVAMVTPEEREAALRAAGEWPADEPDPTPAPAAAPEVEPPRELTPNEQYIAEHCFWRPRGPADIPRRHREGRCLTEYDVITGEIIGDGYRHDENDEW